MSKAVSAADPLATEAVVALFRLSDALGGAARALCAKHGITTPAAFNVLAILDGEGGPLAPSVIAARMVVSRPTITGIVDSLARRGQVKVLAHPSDRRMSLVELTGAGRSRVRRMQANLHDLEAQWLSDLPDAEKRQVAALAERLIASLPAELKP